MRRLHGFNLRYILYVHRPSNLPLSSCSRSIKAKMDGMDQTTRMLLTNHCRSPDNARLAHREQLSRESFCRFYTPWKCPYVAPSSAALSMMTPAPRCGGHACLEAWEFQRGVELGMAVRNVKAQVQSERR